jgi:acetyltransferase-like isoleucine patch superfamily enzyme
LIGNNVIIFDSDFHDRSPITRHSGTGESKKVVIGYNVWIGTGATILKGAEIGDNSIISANVLCYQNVPRNTIVAGNPAVIICELIT